MASFKTEGVALVVGAGSGIGAASAHALAEAGARVVVYADIKYKSAVEQAELGKKYATDPEFKSSAYEIDVTKEESVEKVMDEVVKEFGRLDYLINSAGVDNNPYLSIPDDSIEDYDRVHKVNARGMLLCSRAAIKKMAEQEPRKFTSPITKKEKTLSRGVIVNMASVLGYAAVEGKVGYLSSKHAALGITKATALDVVSKNIRVNAVCPAWTRSGIYEDEIRRAPETPGLIEAVVPAKRPAEPEEVGEAVVFLCSPAASYVNGTGLIIDSGLTLTVHMG